MASGQKLYVFMTFLISSFILGVLEFMYHLRNYYVVA
jgi:hypothetical protein